MGNNSPVHIDGAAGRWVVWPPGESGGLAESRLGAPLGLGTAAGVVVGFAGGLGVWTLLVPIPVIAFISARDRARRRRDERVVVYDSTRFADLSPESVTLANRLVISLATLFASRTAGAGWIDPATLTTAHKVTWAALRTLSDTADLHTLLRESREYPELSAEVEERTGQLRSIEAEVGAVADRMDEVISALAVADQEIAAAEAAQARAEHVEHLRERLSGSKATPAPPQVDLDAITAAVTAAAEILTTTRSNL
ncbi:hypothetical protein JOD54_003850 [Actinokineospora baliensis]|uniref:hypothetical protein n=1 Tax=Actinokineospora baliensis TaxID=547056 RepID=UPI001957EC1A|nr:hypothetical protein [Actinokineospora baliensis]MBM7773646.1 hypothetical protein [Actinokineospora baliensis]